jgi:hypothetical protein
MRYDSVCICDDDNDMEMALACRHAYIPAMASESVAETIMGHPGRFTQTFRPGKVEMTRATDAALESILEQVKVESKADGKRLT